ncbi:MmpS family transport accessory protein [Mycobacterium parmense]|uniref:Uncharacterized protein n=1 Tax=Mycobacterium parmense TaxID=185642 RepID=A0A7I7YUC4_9MYCO|nr:MmpS family transport accessory protein [Mycobacterium parmense]MCV7351084.1 hypothetical protein [Mycobacterium parmense]ORW60652.1 hypothetical protein AWC20_06670 [Mycobacterium parmense]BBZ45475.1 hypothetical protein MPRM_27560 [Mycobacterium parmense]
MGTTLSQRAGVRESRGDFEHLDEDDWDTDDTDVYPDDDYTWTGWPVEFRWRSVTAVLGVVVAVGAIATAVIINSGDSASTKATVGPSAPRPLTSAPAAPKTTAASAAPSVAPSQAPSVSAAPQLPAETFTTVTTPSAPPAYGPGYSPGAPTVAAPPSVAPPLATLNPRTVVYTVTGTKQLLDLVNVVYTDARGYPQTEFNVSLPWSRAVVLNPGVQTQSVVATSFLGRLDCSIVNAAGETVVASTANSNLATCTK